MPADDRPYRLGAELLAPYALIANARDVPDAIALENVETGAVWTHATLLDGITRWASALAVVGVGPGDHVATMLVDQADGIHSWLGAAFAGAVEVPLNPQHRGELLRQLLSAISARVLVVDAAVLGELDLGDVADLVDTIVVHGPGSQPYACRGTPIVDLGPLVAAPPTITDPPPIRYCDTATVIFTSGTTGPSKGVIVPWATAYQLVSWMPADSYTEGEGLFCPLPMFHLAGKSAFTSTLIRRARYVYRQRFSASSFLDDVRSSQCVVANVVGPMLSFLADTPPGADDAENPVRVVACGPMIRGIESFERRFGVHVVTCYGMTEIGSVLTTDQDHGPWNACGRVREGYPWPEVRIVNDDDEEVGPGEVGELIVRTAAPWAFSPGYLGAPAATAEAWRNGWFHSGDALRVDDAGNYYLVDRFKDTIRRRGENVSSFEVESIASSHEAVRECAAVGVPGAHGDDDIVLFVIPTAPGAVGPDALRDWFGPRLPSHMVPAEIRVVDDLPRNATTLRVKKHDLRRIASEGRQEGVGT